MIVKKEEMAKARRDASFIKDILGLFQDNFIKITITQSICKKIDQHMELLSRSKASRMHSKSNETMFYSQISSTIKEDITQDVKIHFEAMVIEDLEALMVEKAPKKYLDLIH